MCIVEMFNDCAKPLMIKKKENFVEIVLRPKEKSEEIKRKEIEYKKSNGTIGHPPMVSRSTLYSHIYCTFFSLTASSFQA